MRPPFACPRLLSRLSLLLLLLVPFAMRAQTYPQPTVARTPSFEPPWPTSIVGGSLQVPGRTDLIAIYRSQADPSPGYPLNADVGTGQFLNNGTGTLTFTSQNSGEFTATLVVATIADFNGDGTQDVAFATSNAQRGFEDLCVNFSKGGGAYDFTQSGCTSLALVKTVQPQLTYLAAIPLRTGGLPQLILEDSANGFLYIVANTGAPNPTPGALPSFTVKARYPIPADGAGPLSVADLNGDGNLDFILNGQTGHSASVYLGNGDGTFQPPVVYTFGSGVRSLQLHDMDGDGRLDMVTETNSGAIEIHRGQGDGTFAAASMGGTAASLDPRTGNGGHLVGVADLNHDGIADLITSTPAGISVMLGLGAMTYAPATIYNAGPGHSSFVLADFNGDGNLDLAVDSPEGTAILFGNSDGSFQTSRAFSAGQPALSIATAQFTSSGNLDAVVSTAATQAQVLLGQGDGRLLAPGYPGQPTPTTTQTGNPGLWSQVAAADLDGDGRQDLVFTADGALANLPSTGSGLSAQSGNGDGTFSAPVAIPVANQFAQPNPATCQPSISHFPASLFGSSVLADFTGDGLLDIANRDSGAFRVLRGNARYTSSSSFAPPTLFWSGSDGTANTSDCNLNAHSRVASGDFNGDGRPDLVFQSNGSLGVYLTDSTGTPQPMGDLAVDGSLTTPGQLTAPDLSSTFGGPSVALAGNYAIGAMTTADLDRDGNTDLLVTYHNLSADPTYPVASAPNFLYLWFGSGGGKFLTSAKHPVNPVRIQLSRNFYQVAVADLNGDGIPDLILSDGYLIDVQLGKGDGTFGPEQHLLAGAGINGIVAGKLRPGSSTPADLLVANGGTTLANPVANRETLTPNPDVNTGGVTVLLNAYAQYTPTGTIAATPEPSTAGNSIKVTVWFYEANVAAPLTALSYLTLDGAPYGQSNPGAPNIANEVEYYTLTGVAAGVHQVCGVYAGDSHNSPFTVCLTHTVNAGASTSAGTLSASPEPSAFESPFTLTATVTATTGTVQFAVDGTALGTPVPVSSTGTGAGTASITDSATLLPGAHTLTATYFAAASALAVALTPATHTVSRAPTSVVLNPTTPLTVYYGQDIDGTFTIHTLDQVNYPYTGNYTLQDNGVAVPICTNLPANQSCPYGAPILLDAGPHSFVVSYLGDPINAPSSSPAILYTVLPDLTTATLASSANPSVYGSVLTLTATITGNAAIPNGTVTFLDGTTVLGTATLNASGIATFQTSTLAPGQHSLSVNYPGTLDFNPASTAGTPLLQVITLPPIQLPTAVTLTSSLNPAGPTQTIVFTAAVTVPGPFPIVPTGTVSFIIDGKAAGTATLDGFGLARLTVSQLATGQHTVIATYAGVMGTGSGSPPVKPPSPPQPPNPRATTGTQTLLPSTSAPLLEIITYAINQAPVGFTLEISPTPVTLGVGRYALLLVKITDLSGFNQPVALSCSGLPDESTCTFAQPTVAPGGGSTTLQLQVSAPHDCGNPGSPYFLGSATPPSPLGRTLPYGTGVALAGVVALGLRRRRRDGRALRLTQNALLLTLLSAALYALSGCGHCTDLGTRPGNYSFTVTAVAQGTPVAETQSQTIGLTVTIP